MTPGMIRFVVILIYLACLLALGIGSSLFLKSTKRDYLLASSSVGPFLLLMSLFGTTMTAFALVGSTGESFKEGIGVYGQLASSSGIVHSLCFFLVGVKVWTLGKKYGYSTQVEFFRDRLNNNSFGLLLFPILVGLIIPYLLIGVISSGSVVQGLTAGAFPNIESFQTDNPGTSGGIPPWLGSLGISIVVLAYVFLGGMRGTAWANTMQTIVFMVLGVVTFYVVATKLGGKPSLLESMQELSGRVGEDKATRSEMSQTKFLTYMLVPLSVGMFPHVFQHWLTAKSAKSFRLPIVFQPVFIMIVWVPCVLIGIWATTDLVPAQPPLPSNPNVILPFLASTQAAPVLGGLLAAGILAAIMSSLDSQFLCLGTMFTNDVVGNVVGKDKLTDRQTVWLARGFIVAIVAVTYAISLTKPVSVFQMGVWCFSGYTGLFPLVIAALYWRRLTLYGAVASVLVSIGIWSYYFHDSGYGSDTQYTVDLVQVDAEAREQVLARKTELKEATREDLVAAGVAQGVGTAESLEPLADHRIIVQVLEAEFEGKFTRYKTMAVLWVFLGGAISVLLVSLITPSIPSSKIEKFFPAKISTS